MPSFIQPSFAKGVIAPALHGRVDTAAYAIALKTGRNAIVHPYGGVSNRPGTEFIGPVATHSYAPRLIPFSFKTTDEYVIEVGNLYARFIRDDAYVTETPVAITGATQASPGVVTAVAHGFATGNEVYISGVVGMTRLNTRRFLVGTTTANTFQLKDQVTNANVDTTGYTAYSSAGTVARIYQLTTPWATADLFSLKFTQSADVMTITHKSYQTRELTRTGHAAWTIGVPTFAPVIAAPASIIVTPTVPGAITYDYKVTTTHFETGEQSLAGSASTATGANPPSNTVSWSAAGDAGFYSVYRLKNGTYGFIGTTETVSFLDDNVTPDPEITPPVARDPFSAIGTYAGAVGYYEQRRVFGGSTNAPDKSEYSQVGNHKNFTRSVPSQQDDAFAATLYALKVNEIRHYVPGKTLIVLTSGSEFQVDSGTDAAFSAETARQKPQSFWGSGHQQPVVVGNTILFVEENNASVRSLGYSLQIDGYTGTDMGLLANHYLFDKTISDWAFSHSPDNTIHMVRSDGDALALTLQQEQEVIAWTHWDTLGKFEAVAALRHGDDFRDDRVYFVVKRKINGNTVRYIEKLHSRAFTDVRDAFFVDCGLSYDLPVVITGATAANPVVITATAHGFSNGDEVDIFDIEWEPDFDDLDNETQPDQLNRRRFIVANVAANTFELTTSAGNVNGSSYSAYIEGGTVRKAVSTITGLDHLEGRAIVGLCDGNVCLDLTVSNGAVTLPRKFSRVHLGLKYITDIETLSIEIAGGGGTTLQSKPKKIPSVILRLEKSRGLFVGPDSDNLEEYKQREGEDMGDPTDLLTGDTKPIPTPSAWNRNGSLFIRQRYPLPLSILAIIPDIVTGGDSRDD